MAGHADVCNSKQLLFAQAVAAGKKLTEAYRIAGYADTAVSNVTSRAARLARVPVVAAEIDRQMAVRDSVQEMSAEWWRTELVYQYNKVRGATNATDALRALEIAGKYLGMLEPRDGDRDENAARLLQNATTLMALQMAAQAQAKGPGVKTVDATVREVMGLPAGDA